MDRTSGRHVEIAYADQRATVVERGGGLGRYTAAGTEIVDGYPEGEACDGGRGQVLAPWPNRLDAGRYAWRGRTFDLPITEPGRATANHGLVRRERWTVERRAAHEAVARLVLEPREGYPFRLGFEIRYALRHDGLTVVTSVENLGSGAAPFGLGFHPYLSPRTPLDEAILRLDADVLVELDERGLPTGTRTVVRDTPVDLSDGRPIAGRVLDHCYTALSRDGGVARALLGAPDASGCTLWMDETFDYVMVFTGDTLAPERRRQSVAVEPMTCPPNAFNSGDDLIAFEPGERRVFRWGIAPGTTS